MEIRVCKAVLTGSAWTQSQKEKNPIIIFVDGKPDEPTMGLVFIEGSTSPYHPMHGGWEAESARVLGFVDT